jgi:hypothetical protein
MPQKVVAMDKIILLPAGPDGGKRKGDGDEGESKKERFMSKEKLCEVEQGVTLIGNWQRPIRNGQLAI